MIKQREIIAAADSYVVLEGAGVPVRRVLPHNRISYGLVDPFLLLDEGELKVDKNTPNFPEHPHRGFEIVTYCLKGTIHQVQKTAGGEDYAEVREGGLLRITAGSGMSHGEGIGKSDETEVHILQLWINLPRAQKGIEPSFQVVETKEIPQLEKDGVVTRVLVGQNSPTGLLTPMVYHELTFTKNVEFGLDIPDGYQGFVYVLEGSGEFGSNRKELKTKQIGVINETGHLKMKCLKDTHLIVCAGQPILESPRWLGPFVD